MHLVTGAAVPEEGVVVVGGRDTRDHRDRHRVARLARSVRHGHRSRGAARQDVDRRQSRAAADGRDRSDLAGAAGADRRTRGGRGVARAPARSTAAGSLTAVERVRVHLARALAHEPELLLLEHPTCSDGRSRSVSIAGADCQACGGRPADRLDRVERRRRVCASGRRRPDGASTPPAARSGAITRGGVSFAGEASDREGGFRISSRLRTPRAGRR